jgi:hypothetical protein
MAALVCALVGDYRQEASCLARKIGTGALGQGHA